MAYQPISDETRTQLVNLFLPPVNQIFDSGVIQRPVVDNEPYSSASKKIKNSHRDNILDNGRADFDTDSDGLTGMQKVDLYCYYYFQMHCASSFQFYLNETEFLQETLANRAVWFIDIGCGPFTSGLVFNSWLKQYAPVGISANYVGIDISKNMLTKAEQILESTPNLRFNEYFFLNNKNEALGTINENGEQEIVIILNYSYLFASTSLDVQDFLQFTNSLRESYPQARFIIFQQNPRRPDLNEKWEEYKSQLVGFTSKVGYPHRFGMSFDDILESCNYLKPNFGNKIKCDLLKSF